MELTSQPWRRSCGLKFWVPGRDEKASMAVSTVREREDRDDPQRPSLLLGKAVLNVSWAWGG